MAVVNNVEADHLECYGSLRGARGGVRHLRGPRADPLVGVDDPGAARLAARLGPGTLRFGSARGRGTPDLGAFGRRPERTSATVRLPGRDGVTLRLQVPGLHNLRNATAALGVVHALGGVRRGCPRRLAEFRGVGRRFERLGDAGGVTLVDDYAHHPTELVATLEAARQAFPGRRLVAVFQPHLYQPHPGARRGDGPGAGGGRRGGRHRDLRRAGAAGRRASAARWWPRRPRAAGADVHFAPVRSAVADVVAAALVPGDVVLTLGAGDITRVGPELAVGLRAG